MQINALLKKIIPTISDDTSYYYIKTNNGHFYHQYKQESIVGLNNVDVNLSPKPKYLKIFIDYLKISDFVLIANFRHKNFYIGEITSDIYYENEKIYRKVKWLKEVECFDLGDKAYKYISKANPIININCLATDINRLLYPIYDKSHVYHFVFKVKQEENILFKSLYGLHQLFDQDEIIDELKIKISVQSPGIVELITNNLDIIIMIIKTIKVINLLTKNETPSNSKLIKKYNDIKNIYQQYEIERLKLIPPKVDDEIYEKCKEI